MLILEKMPAETDLPGLLTDVDDMDESLFDDIIRLYQMLLTNMIEAVQSYVFDDVKARSRPYRTEKYVETRWALD